MEKNEEVKESDVQKEAQKNIDVLLEEKVKPIVKEATTKAFGLSVDKLTEDITAKLAKSPLLEFPVNTLIKFKHAKKLCKKAYIEKMLELHLGNISEVAREAGTDRRSIHRLIRQLHINMNKIKRELIRPYDVKLSILSHAIEDVLEKYRSVFHPEKLERMYKDVNTLSENLIKELPEKKLTLKQAEEDFERAYIKKALEQNNNNIPQTAKKIGLRYETLQRKMKAFNIWNSH